MHKDDEVTFKGLFLPLTTKKAIVFIFLIGFIVFFNSLFNPFQFDDFAQIVNNPFINNLGSIPSYFEKGMAFSGNYSFKMLHLQYRPFYFSYFTIVYAFFGANPLPFHLFQLFLHITNSILLFVIFSKLFKKEIAFLISLIFLVHPINSEAVIYIADVQETIFILFGLIAFYLILQTNKRILSIRKLILISVLLLFSLFTKETGSLFLILLFIYVYLFSKVNKKRFFLSVMGVLLIYLVTRYIISFNSVTDISQSLIQQASFYIRLITMPKIFFYYFSKFVYPINLAVGQLWLVKQINFTYFFLPLLMDIVILFTICLGGLFLFKKNNSQLKLYVFFSIWLFLGIIMHLQIVPLDVTVADRYFYFPIIGLLGLIGILINLDLSQLFLKKYSRICTIFFIILMILLSIITIIRNSQWQSTFTLYSHDVQYAQSPLLDSYYGGLLIFKGQYSQPFLLKEAKFYLDRSVSQAPELGHNINNLAVWYEINNDYEKAKSLYLKNIALNSKRKNGYTSDSYTGLAHIALNEKNPLEAKRMSQEALKINSLNIHAKEYLAISEYQLGEKVEALNIIRELYYHVQNQEIVQLYMLINLNKPFTLSPKFGLSVVY